MKSGKEIRDMIEELEKSRETSMFGVAQIMISILEWVLETPLRMQRKEEKKNCYTIIEAYEMLINDHKLKFRKESSVDIYLGIRKKIIWKYFEHNNYSGELDVNDILSKWVLENGKEETEN